MPIQPFSAYNNWGHYDELGDKIPLTEKLVLEELDTFERWQRDLDLSFDTFIIDCLWFEDTEPYTVFRRADWPDGPDRVLNRMRALGMSPGLWFSTNGGRLNVPAWEESRCANNWSYSLADGPYGDGLENGFLHAAREWGVRLFKLDFAGLQSAAKGVERSPQETMRRSVKRLKQAVSSVKAEFPDAYFLTHCGFARKNNERLVGAADPYEVDTGWMDTFDAMFSGDPCCTDIPQTALARNLDLFQDREVWKMHTSGWPLHRIEDHGAVMGPTNTAMYRGRAGFRRTHLGQLARGGRRDMLYGDPTVLRDSDVRAMKAARELFFHAWDGDLWTRFVGPGEPGIAPWHGCLTGGGDAGLLYLVNSSLATQRVEIPLLNLMTARLLFHDGARPALQVQPERLAIELGPEQAILLGLGTYADANWDLPPQTDLPIPASTRLVEAQFRPAGNGIVADIPKNALAEGEQLLVLAQVLDTDSAGPLQALPFRFGKQSTRESDDMTPQAHEQVCITCAPGGAPVPPVCQVPDVPVWSGISWVARAFQPGGACRLTVTQTLDPPRRLRVTTLAIR